MEDESLIRRAERLPSDLRVRWRRPSQRPFYGRVLIGHNGVDWDIQHSLGTPNRRQAHGRSVDYRLTSAPRHRAAGVCQKERPMLSVRLLHPINDDFWH